jgi:hypothetical protein
MEGPDHRSLIAASEVGLSMPKPLGVFFAMSSTLITVGAFFYKRQAQKEEEKKAYSSKQSR